MSRFSRYVTSLMILLFLATACSGPQTVILTSADNGNKVVVREGGQVIIHLESNPSTGYTWEAKDLDTTMFQQVGDAVFTSSNPGLVGSAGILVLTFQAIKPGSSTLTLVYHRPWETGVDPVNSFSVTVRIK
jgi:inhibitor of cysteine peptidase